MLKFDHAKYKSQSAAEYLSTYGWAILIIAVVLAVLYQLGVFGGSNFTGSSCLAVSGFLCKNVVLNGGGTLSFVLGYVGSQTLTITGVGCSNTTNAPSSFPGVGATLTSEQNFSASVKCSLPSQAIGTPFSGTLWIQYSSGSQTGLVLKVADIRTTIITPKPGAQLLSPVYYPGDLTVVGGNAYWVDGNGRIMKQSLTGAPGSNTIFYNLGGNPNYLTSDGTNLYWTAMGAIQKQALNGAPNSNVVLCNNQNNYLYGIVVYNGNVYWPSYGGTINTESINGALNSNAVLATGQGDPQGLSVYNGNLFWVSESYDTVYQMPTTGGTVTTLASFAPYSYPFWTTVTNGYLYWVNYGDGSVNKIPIGGGTITQLATGQTEPSYIVTDGTYVYLSNSWAGPGSIQEESINGVPGSNVTIAVRTRPNYLNITNGNLYWSEGQASGNVMSIGVP